MTQKTTKPAKYMLCSCWQDCNGQVEPPFCWQEASAHRCLLILSKLSPSNIRSLAALTAAKCSERGSGTTSPNVLLRRKLSSTSVSPIDQTVYIYNCCIRYEIIYHMNTIIKQLNTYKQPYTGYKSAYVHLLIFDPVLMCTVFLPPWQVRCVQDAEDMQKQRILRPSQKLARKLPRKLARFLKSLVL